MRTRGARSFSFRAQSRHKILQNRWRGSLRLCSLSAFVPAAGRCADAAADRVRRAGCREFFCTCSFFCESHPCTMNELRRVCLRHLHAACCNGCLCRRCCCCCCCCSWPRTREPQAATAGPHARSQHARDQGGGRCRKVVPCRSVGLVPALSWRSNRTRAAVDPGRRKRAARHAR